MASLPDAPRPVLALSWPSVLLVLGLALLGYLASCNPTVSTGASEEPPPTPPTTSLHQRVVAIIPTGARRRGGNTTSPCWTN